MDTTPIGKVYLIGAGPGDPQLITLKGVECLHRCDIILYDGLANALLLNHAKADVITQCVGKHGHGGMWTQQEINKRIIEFAKSGKSVARLKGGDTAIFARTAEEVEELEAANIPYEIVPGITAAMAATSLAGTAPASDEAPPAAGEQIVTPWDVQGGEGRIDYDKLLSTFGCQPISPELIARCAGCVAAANGVGPLC